MPIRGPRILVYVTVFPVVSQTTVVDHIRGLLRHGWEVHLVCLELDVELLHRHRDLTSEIESIHVLGRQASRPPSVTRRAWRLIRTGRKVRRTRRSSLLRRSSYVAPPLGRVVRAVRPDLVHAHWGQEAVDAAAAVRTQGVPLVAELHGFDITQIPLHEGWGPYREWLRPHTVVVHSEFARRLVREGVSMDPVMIRYGVDRAFVPTPRSSAWPRPLRLTTVGRLVPEKGHDTVIESIAVLSVRRGELDPHLTIAGSGPYEEALRRLVLARGLDDRVRFVGSLATSEVAELMARTDVLVVASRRSEKGWIESFGRVAAEGVVSGVAVIVSRSGGLPEAVGDAGYVVEPGDPSAIAAAVDELVDHSRPDEIARRARSYAATMTIDRYWSETDALDRRAAGIGRRR